jgi:hemoglobin-like flavoprotein
MLLNTVSDPLTVAHNPAMTHVAYRVRVSSYPIVCECLIGLIQNLKNDFLLCVVFAKYINERTVDLLNQSIHPFEYKSTFSSPKSTQLAWNEN